MEEAGRVLGGGATASFTNRIVCKDGSFRWLEWTSTAVPEERVLYGLARDVTDRRGPRRAGALRRLATLAAAGVQPEHLFAVVAEEVARVVDVPLVRVVRYEPDDTATECARFPAEERVPFPSGRRSKARACFGSCERAPARPASTTTRGLDGEIAEIARRSGIRSAVGSPIVVAGRSWGAVVASSTERLPDGTESRLADFTELLATAIANAESRAALERLADEQAALRRVAVLVARQPSPDEIFTAVTEAVGRLLGVDLAAMHIFPGDGTATAIAGWSIAGPMLPIGTRLSLGGDSVTARIFDTGAPARIDTYVDVEGDDRRGRPRPAPAVDGRRADPRRREALGRADGGNPRRRAAARGGRDPYRSFHRARGDRDLQRASSRGRSHSWPTSRPRCGGWRRWSRKACRRPRSSRPSATRSAACSARATATVGRFDHDGPAVVIVGVAKHRASRSGRDGSSTTVRLRGGLSAPDARPVSTRSTWSSAAGRLRKPLRRLRHHLDGCEPDRRRRPSVGRDERLGQTSTAARRRGTAGEVHRARRDRDRERGQPVRARRLAQADRRRVGRGSPPDRARPPRRHAAAAGLARPGAARRRGQRPSRPAASCDRSCPASRAGLADAVADLQEISRGIHPAILSEGGLGPALRTLARRSAIPVELDVTTTRGFPSRSRSRRTSSRRRRWPTRRSMRRRRASRSRSRRATAACCSRFATTASAEPIRRAVRAWSALPTASRRSAARSKSAAMRATGRASPRSFRSSSVPMPIHGPREALHLRERSHNPISGARRTYRHAHRRAASWDGMADQISCSR